DINYSDKKVLRLMINKIKNRLQNSPNAKYIGVSQADIVNDLKKIENSGLNSDVVLSFANSIAKFFPNKIITTLAYQYSRNPPQHIKPEKNVLVLICNTTGNRSQASNLHSNDFIKDLRGWQKLTDNILVWDYATNTKYPLSPFP